MSIVLTKMQASNRQALYETLLTFWKPQWDEQFVRDFLEWRYERRVEGETLLAMSGDRCIAVIDAFIRPYLIGGKRVLVREPCDWYCLPGSLGAGMRLMKFLQSQGDPLVGVGLPAGAVAIAPRLKWTHEHDTRDFILPLTIRRVVGALLRKTRLGDGSSSRYLPRGLRLRPTGAWRKFNHAQGVVEEMDAAQWPVEEWPVEKSGEAGRSSGANDGAVADDYAVAPVLTQKYVEWLAEAPPTLGPMFSLGFRTNGELIGITLCRIEASKIGRKARLIHLHSSNLSVGILTWMIAENVRRAAEFHAESIHVRSSCHATNLALASLGFRSTACAAVMTRFADHALPAGGVNITFLRGDDAMIPSLIAE